MLVSSATFSSSGSGFGFHVPRNQMKIDTQDECSIATVQTSFAVVDICYKLAFCNSWSRNQLPPRRKTCALEEFTSGSEKVKMITLFFVSFRINVHLVNSSIGDISV